MWCTEGQQPLFKLSCIDGTLAITARHRCHSATHFTKCSLNDTYLSSDISRGVLIEPEYCDQAWTQPLRGKKTGSTLTVCLQRSTPKISITKAQSICSLEIVVVYQGSSYFPAVSIGCLSSAKQDAFCSRCPSPNFFCVHSSNHHWRQRQTSLQWLISRLQLRQCYECRHNAGTANQS